MRNSKGFVNCFLAGIGGCYERRGENSPAEREQVHWWILIVIAAAAGLLLYGLFRWSAGAPEIDDEIAKERFRAEQDWRNLRRSGHDVPPNRDSKEVKMPS